MCFGSASIILASSVSWYKLNTLSDAATITLHIFSKSNRSTTGKSRLTSLRGQLCIFESARKKPSDGPEGGLDGRDGGDILD